MVRPKTEPTRGSLLQRLRDWRHDRASDAELRSLPEADLARLATDVGVNAGDLRALSAKGSHASDLLPRRLLSLGLDPRDIARDPASLRDLQRVCSLCTSKRRCRHDLDRMLSQWPSYCPNAESLRILTAQNALHAHRAG